MWMKLKTYKTTMTKTHVRKTSDQPFNSLYYGQSSSRAIHISAKKFQI